MKQNIVSSLVSGLVVGLVILAGWAVLLKKDISPLGGQTRSSFATTGNLSASGTLDVAGSTTLNSSTFVGNVTLPTSTFGNVGGTGGAIQGIRCVSQDYDPPSLGTGATSSVDITAAGFTNGTASNTVAYSVGFGTSTFDIELMANASGSATSSAVAILFRSASGTRNLGNAALTVCAIDS